MRVLGVGGRIVMQLQTREKGEGVIGDKKNMKEPKKKIKKIAWSWKGILFARFVDRLYMSNASSLATPLVSHGLD